MRRRLLPRNLASAGFIVGLMLGWASGARGQVVSSAPVATLAAIEARSAALRAPQLAAEQRSLPATIRPTQTTNPNEVGYVLGVSSAAADLRWSPAGGKGRAIRLELVSENATALRVSLRRDKLPRSMEVRFYAPGGEQALGPYRPAVSARGEEWWSPIITGSRMGIEFYLGSDAQADAPAPQIESIAYIYAIEELSCHIPITDHPEWATEASAVAKISFNDLDCSGIMKSFMCTAFLLNRTINDAAPLAMTANHCIDNEAAANTVTFRWFFDTPAAPVVQTLGARLLNNHVNNDCTLLALDQRPPGGAAFLTYDIGPWPRDLSITGIHHPAGTFKRISFGTFTGGGFDFFSICGSRVINNFGVTYTSGTTEGGSSGSPLFDSNRRVRGPLSGSFDNGCAPINDKYGRLDGAFPNFQAYLTTIASPVWLDALYPGFEDGTSAQPFRTIIKAAAVVRAGEQISIRPGTYERTTLYRPMTLVAPVGGVTIGP